MIVNIFAFTFILICYIALLIITEKIFTFLLDRGHIKQYAKRVSKLFIQRKYKISEHHSLQARKELKQFKKENKNTPFNIKLQKAGAILNNELMNLITSDKLEKNIVYSAETHLIGRLRKAERLGYIELVQTTFIKRKLLVEAITFLSLKEIIKYKTHLRKNFFKVRFVVK